MTNHSKRPNRRSVIAAGGCIAAAAALPGWPLGPGPAQAATKLRIGSLKFGSLAWLLDTVVANGLDKAEGVEFDLVDMASTGAAKIALLSGDADIIVSDWPWAMRQRSEGEPVRFAPYSSALGSVMVASDSSIQTIGDLAGKRLGVAGTALDKSWLLLRAYAQKQTGKDIANEVAPIFGAAPLITEQIRQGRVDATLNFWTFSARLKGSGYRELVTMSDILTGLGVTPVPSLVGFIWNEERLAAKGGAIDGFLSAIAKGNQLLASSDEAWDRLRPAMRADADAEFAALKSTYRSGIPKTWTAAETAAAEKLFGLLVDLGDATFVGSKTKFDPALFHGA